jgi:hypothetical protein
MTMSRRERRYRLKRGDSQGAAEGLNLGLVIASVLLLFAASADPIAGIWEGTSLCQVKPSPCHDEHVVYRVKITGSGLYRIDAYKLVAGQEQYMGPLDVRWDASNHELSGFNRDRTGVDHPWLFTVRGDHISGKALTAAGGRVYRLIELTKR